MGNRSCVGLLPPCVVSSTRVQRKSCGNREGLREREGIGKREGEADPAGVSSPLAGRSRSSSRSRPLGAARRARPLRATRPPARVRLRLPLPLCGPVRPSARTRRARTTSFFCGPRMASPVPSSAQPSGQPSTGPGIPRLLSLSLFLLKRSKACMWRVLLSPALFVFSLKKVQSLHVACAAVPCFVCF